LKFKCNRKEPNKCATVDFHNSGGMSMPRNGEILSGRNATA
jgi:hypothetical protein